MSEQESSVEVICLTRGSRPSTAPHINLCNPVFFILGGNVNVRDYSPDSNVRAYAAISRGDNRDNIGRYDIILAKHF